jgi:hypothetical protein
MIDSVQGVEKVWVLEHMEGYFRGSTWRVSLFCNDKKKVYT